MNLEIEKAQRRAIQYRYVDGTFELKLGLTALVLTINTLLLVKPSGPGFRGILTLILSVVLIAGGGWLIDRLVKAIKEKVTFRRSGMITYPSKKDIYPADTLMLFAILVFLAWTSLFSWGEEVLGGNVIIVSAALFMFVILLFTAIRSRIKRYSVLAGVGLLIGLLLAQLNSGKLTSIMEGAIYLAVVSLLFVGTGLLVLLGYLRRHPANDEAVHE